MHPTAARSPTEKPLTADPTSVITPTISWPGTMGNWLPPHSSFTLCRSAGVGGG